LNSKTQEFYVNHLSNGYYVIIITETWLHDDVHDNELLNNDYKVYQSDRQGIKKGGRVLIAVKQGIMSDIRLENDKVESLCIEVKLYVKTLYLYCIFRSLFQSKKLCVIL
jgi:hypothetical protein